MNKKITHKKHNEIDWTDPCNKFYDHFRYFCQIPLTARIDSKKDFELFSELIDKCISDNFDYTIEAYGTVPPKHFGLPEIIID